MSFVIHAIPDVFITPFGDADDEECSINFLPRTFKRSTFALGNPNGQNVYHG
jgi:hypothetical protein